MGSGIFYFRLHAPGAFSNRRQQSGTVNLWVIHGSQATVLNGPPVKISYQGHFGWLCFFLLEFIYFFLCGFNFLFKV